MFVAIHMIGTCMCPGLEDSQENPGQVDRTEAVRGAGCALTIWLPCNFTATWLLYVVLYLPSILLAEREGVCALLWQSNCHGWGLE